MANYETAKDLKDFVDKSVKKVNYLIGELPDISKFYDLIEDISSVSEYIGELSSETDEAAYEKLKSTLWQMKRELNDIVKIDKKLKEKTMIPAYKTVKCFAEASNESMESFLERNFPPILY